MFLENVAPLKKKKKEVVDNVLQIDLEKKYVRTPETKLKRSWPCLFFFNRNENETISKCFKIK